MDINITVTDDQLKFYYYSTMFMNIFSKTEVLVLCAISNYTNGVGSSERKSIAKRLDKSIYSINNVIKKLRDYRAVYTKDKKLHALQIKDNRLCINFNKE